MTNAAAILPMMAPEVPSNGATRVISPKEFSSVEELLQQGVESEAFPGAVLVVAKDGDIKFAKSFGYKGEYGSERNLGLLPMDLDTVFDIAAVSAAVSTTAAMMVLVEQGKLKVSEKISRYIQSFGVYGKGEVTIAQLLNHTSGLPQWVPFYEELTRLNAASRAGLLASRAAKEWVYNSVRNITLKFQPGSRYLYSEVGFIVLGQLIELLTGQTLDQATYRLVFRPLGLRSTSFIDLALIKRRGVHPVPDMIAPTEECSWRERILCGEVHDDNAWAMGGIAGHAGLFSTAADLTSYAQRLIQARRGNSKFLKPETVDLFWGQGAFEKNLPLGWNRAEAENGMEDSGLSSSAIGISGFTGCSLWIEPKLGLSIALMTNRINPNRSNKKLQNLRPKVHKLVLDVVERG